jgi:predicted RNase H-like HicB family nuclease
MRRPSNKPIQVSLSKDQSGQWFAWSDEAAGITGKGKTPDEAVNKFEKAYRYSESILIHRNSAAYNVG